MIGFRSNSQFITAFVPRDAEPDRRAPATAAL
jgi:hypothetical protein